MDENTININANRDEISCFDLICTSYCVECHSPVMSDEGECHSPVMSDEGGCKYICEDCFHQIVQWARRENLFPLGGYWNQGLTRGF